MSTTTNSHELVKLLESYFLRAQHHRDVDGISEEGLKHIEAALTHMYHVHAEMCPVCEDEQ